jgi:hypothetical protein
MEGLYGRPYLNALLRLQSFHLAVSSGYLNGEDWTKQFISIILQITQAQWIFWNISLHDKTHGYLRNKKTDEILQLINVFSEVAPEEIPEDCWKSSVLPARPYSNASVDWAGMPNRSSK